MADPIGIAAGVTAGIVLIWAVVTRNTLVALRNHIRESAADIDVELQRRHDLIPNLVQVVKGYASHERAVLERVAELRHRGRPSRVEDADERALQAGVERLIALAESYPELKADARFADLQREMVITEDRLAAARRFYNGNIRDYRNAREQFPSSLIAKLGGFPPIEWLTAEPGTRTAPHVGG